MTGRHRPISAPLRRRRFRMPSGWPPRMRAPRSLPARLLTGLLAVGLAAAGFLIWPQAAPLRASADFVRAVGLYPGSDVRILGVRVGRVESVEPKGDRVRVTFTYDEKHRVPAAARAAIVAPSLVSDRYVQLLDPAPGAGEDGAPLADGAHIPLARTAVPVELDRVSQSLDDLMVALGPDGANRDGSLSRLLTTSAENLDGNGARLGQTVEDLSQALSTLSENRGDLFGTIENLQSFTTMLAENNDQVRRLNADLATVAVQLGEERENLKLALSSLGTAVDEVSTFVADNRALVKTDLSQLVTVTDSLVKNRQALAETLENAPVALSNLQNAYHPQTGTLDTRNNTKGLDDPLLLLCSIITGPTKTGNTDLCDRLRGTVVGQLPTLQPSHGMALQGSPVPGGFVDVRGADPTLGGLLGGDR